MCWCWELQKANISFNVVLLKSNLISHIGVIRICYIKPKWQVVSFKFGMEGTIWYVYFCWSSVPNHYINTDWFKVSRTGQCCRWHKMINPGNRDRISLNIANTLFVLEWKQEIRTAFYLFIQTKCYIWHSWFWL